MPVGVPVLAAHLKDYPKRRHAAIAHLTHIVDAYDDLPHALGLMVDHGDRHANSGTDVCAQAVHLADVTRAITGGTSLRGERAFKSLAPHPAPLSSSTPKSDDAPPTPPTNATADVGIRDAAMRGFRCVRHVLTTSELAAWEVARDDRTAHHPCFGLHHPWSLLICAHQPWSPTICLAGAARASAGPAASSPARIRWEGRAARDESRYPLHAALALRRTARHTALSVTDAAALTPI
jgi:hypothetical protein